MFSPIPLFRALRALKKENRALECALENERLAIRDTNLLLKFFVPAKCFLITTANVFATVVNLHWKLSCRACLSAVSMLVHDDSKRSKDAGRWIWIVHFAAGVYVIYER